jgi:hypothetical protein
MSFAKTYRHESVKYQRISKDMISGLK